MVVVAGNEYCNIVAVGGGVLRHGGVTGLAAAHGPFLVRAEGAARGIAVVDALALLAGLGDGGVEPFNSVVALKLIVSGKYRVGLGLRRGDGLIGGAFVSVLTGDLFRRDVIVSHVEVIPLAVVALVVLLKLVGGVGEGVGVLAQRLAGEGGHGAHLGRDLAVDAGAVVGGKEVIDAGVALKRRVGAERRNVGVYRGLLLIRKGDAVGRGVVVERLHLRELAERDVKEVILPRAAVGHAAILCGKPRKPRGGVQPEHAGIAAVLARPGVILRGVLIVHLRRGVALAAHGHGRGVLVEEAGVEEDYRGDEQHHENGAYRPAALALGVLLRLFLRGEHFLVSASHTRGLTDLLFG